MAATALKDFAVKNRGSKIKRVVLFAIELFPNIVMNYLLAEEMTIESAQSIEYGIFDWSDFHVFIDSNASPKRAQKLHKLQLLLHQIHQNLHYCQNR